MVYSVENLRYSMKQARTARLTFKPPRKYIEDKKYLSNSRTVLLTFLFPEQSSTWGLLSTTFYDRGMYYVIQIQAAFCKDIEGTNSIWNIFNRLLMSDIVRYVNIIQYFLTSFFDFREEK